MRVLGFRGLALGTSIAAIVNAALLLVWLRRRLGGLDARDNGRAIELKGFDAPYWNTPNAINQRGDIVGFMGTPGDVDGNLFRAFIRFRGSEILYLFDTLPDTGGAR